MPETIIEQLRRRKGYIRTTEVMAILGDVSRQSLTRWVGEGRIPAVNFGNGFKFDPVTLADFLEARTTGAKSRKEAKAA